MNQSIKISQLDDIEKPDFSSSIPMVTLEDGGILTTGTTTIETLRETINIANGFATLSAGLSGTVSGQTFHVYNDASEYTASQYVRTDFGANVVVGADSLPLVIYTGKLLGSVTIGLGSIADLRLFKPWYEGQRIKLISYYADSPSLGGGEFIGHLGTATDDGVMVAAGINFYWKKIHDGALTIKECGGRGDGIADDTPAIIRALATGEELLFTDGTYLVNVNQLTLQSNTMIRFTVNAIIQWVNTTGLSGGNQQAYGFMAAGCSNVSVVGGTYKYADDTMVVFAVQSGTRDLTIEYANVIGPRLIDVADGANNYAASTVNSRIKDLRIAFINATTVSRLTTSAFMQIRFTEGGTFEDIIVYGFYYAAMWWGGDSATTVNGAVGNERKVKNLVFKNIRANIVWAGIWGSMGDRILVDGCRVEAIDPTHCDVGLDLEGCTNSLVVNCYAKNFANGGIATFFYNNQVAFVNNEIIVDNVNSRAARFYNSNQDSNAYGIVVENNRFRGIGVVTAIVQMGAADHLIFRNNILSNVLVWLVANNNGYIECTGNNFDYDTVPYTNFNDYSIYAMLAVGGYHSGGSRASGATPGAKASLKFNEFNTSVTFPGESYALWLLHVGYNNSSFAEIEGGGTNSVGLTADLCFNNAQTNATITCRFKVTNFKFFNKGWATKNINGATLLPKGTVSGTDRLGQVWPNTITDNTQAATTYYDVRQKFELLTPTSAKLGDIVMTPGIGSAAVTRTY